MSEKCNQRTYRSVWLNGGADSGSCEIGAKDPVIAAIGRL